MTYLFKCDKCGNKEEKEKLFSEYSTWKFKQTCSICGGHMTRCLDDEDKIQKGENKDYD